MSWLDIFKKKPRERVSVVGITFEDDEPAYGKSAYTAEEVAEAGADDDRVHRLVWDITTKAYVVAQGGCDGIWYFHKNAKLLKRTGKQLRRIGYIVRFTPGGEDSIPNLSISW